MSHGTARLWINLGGGVSASAVLQLAKRASSRDGGIEVTLTASRGARLPDPVPDGLQVATRPVDIRQLYDRFLEEQRPDVVVFTGNDLLLNAVPACHDRGIPVILVSAQVPDSAGLRQRWSEFRTRSKMRLFSHVLAATEADAARFRMAGGPETRVEVLGGLGPLADPLPYDAEEYEALAGLIGGRPVWAAASLRNDEHEAVDEAHRTASRLSHRLLLIAEPVEPALGPELARQMIARGWTVALRSEGEDPEDDVQILIADLPGETGLWYRLAPISFIGSSLSAPSAAPSPFGAAALGSAIVHGPEMRFAEETARLHTAGASRTVRNGKELGEALAVLLSPDRCARQAHRAWEVTSAGSEALDRALAVITENLERAAA